jgi:hypothetical protein
VPNPLLSFKTLAWFWSGMALLAASGALALQATSQDAVPIVMLSPSPAAAAEPAFISVPLPETTPLPVPFQNRSLLAMLPPPGEQLARPATHAPVIHPAAAVPLPIPPVPPVQRFARAEPRRPAPPSAQTYAAAPPRPDYPAWAWNRPIPYPSQYASVRQYQYGPPPGYYGWQPYY